MTLSSLLTVLRLARLRRPFLLYAFAWTALLTASVAVASMSPEVAFMAAVSPSSGFARACPEWAFRVPVDAGPGEVVCVPARLFGRSELDLIVPPVFAALVVAASALFVRAVGLWEVEEEEPSIL
ncbi:hypothetical protein QJS04_geneDACA022353 [Acorus gramineus]|uniref:Uncharacterized protein n=1 Tax=Acorus gramineus TaxID=55184 RepID=A0AAV9B5G0_ACOGR|nr:hypothetical protein QJS04_geneDACA024954 [Acorus gramineus]KAK1271309.1 hypothetical protein QJS04_geneDACA022353 [Acorus gramineus]